LAVSEPDDIGGLATINSEMIKKLTGSEDITARNLYEPNITFKPTFTTELYTNFIPKLSKLDGGIARRLKVINYPYSFVDTPNPNSSIEKQRDYTIQTKFESKPFIKEYILLLIEYALKHHKDDISKMETPIEVKKEIDDYIEENNPIKMWITNCVINCGGDIKIKTSDAHRHYVNSEYCEQKLSAEKFSKMMSYNKYERKKISGVYHYKGIQLITPSENKECEIETL
jgi:putative DNA primase/helicase